MFVRRIPLENVPDDEEKAAAWLQNLFVEKDKIIDSFHTTGSFFETSGFKETAYKHYPKRLCNLVNFALWALVSISLLLYYLISSLVFQNWIGLSIAIGILVTCKCNKLFSCFRFQNYFVFSLCFYGQGHKHVQNKQRL